MRRRLSVTEFESRLTPAYNLVIDGDALTVGITADTATTPGTTIFSPNADGAKLAVDDIETALNSGNVVVRGKTGGTGPGFISWSVNSAADHLEYLGAAKRGLTIETAFGAPDAYISLSNLRFQFDDNVDLTVATSTNVNLTNFGVSDAASIYVASFGTVGVSGGIDSSLRAASGDVKIQTALTVVNRGLQLASAAGDVDVDTPVTVLAGQTLFADAPAGNVRFRDDLYGGGAVSAGAVNTILEDGAGTAGPLGTFVLRDGDVSKGLGTTVRANEVRVGDGVFAFNRPTPVWDMNVTGSVRVLPDGILAPAGQGVRGTLAVTGALTFDGGTLEIDAGNPSDRVTAGGDVDINANSRLTGRFGNFVMSAAHHDVISAGGTRTGQFANAPTGTTFLAGRDIAQVSAYTAKTVVIAPAPAAVNNVAAGTDADGTKYTLKLTGPGELVTAANAFRTRLDVVVRGGTPTTKVVMTTAANLSDTTVNLGYVGVNGALSSFTAPRANLLSELRTDERINALSLQDAYGTLNLGLDVDPMTVKLRNLYGGSLTYRGRFAALTVAGVVSGPVSVGSVGTLTATAVYDAIDAGTTIDRITVKNDWYGDLTAGGLVKTVQVGGHFNGDLDLTEANALSFGSFYGDIEAVGTIKALTTKRDLTARLDVDALGAVRVGGVLRDTGGEDTWQVTGAVASVTAGAVQGFDLAAGSLGTLTVRGNAALGLPANVDSSSFRLSGNTGPAAGSFGLKTVSVAGNVNFSSFFVPNGNVGAFTAARFRASRLYVGYAPSVNPDVAFFTGTFNAGYRLGAFTVTARPQGDAGNPSNYAFNGGEVVAEAAGTVRLSGLATNMTDRPHGGVKTRLGTASLRVAAADDARIPLNVNVSSSPSALANDFYFLDV